MSKELEALRNFISECENDWKTQPKRWVDGAINSNVSKYMDSLKSILTPPTAKEERAKKVEELLKYQSNYINSIIDSLNVIIEKGKSSQEMVANVLEELK